MTKTSSRTALKQIDQRRSHTLTSIATEAIQEMISGGELSAGDRINESFLAEHLGISRGPIREACRSLQEAGLLKNHTNRGMYVREMSKDEAVELYELRGALAGLIGELIADRGSDDDIRALDDMVNKMQAAAVQMTSAPTIN